jgi:hypothetical protein
VRPSSGPSVGPSRGPSSIRLFSAVVPIGPLFTRVCIRAQQVYPQDCKWPGFNIPATLGPLGPRSLEKPTSAGGN